MITLKRPVANRPGRFHGEEQVETLGDGRVALLVSLAIGIECVSVTDLTVFEDAMHVN